MSRKLALENMIVETTNPSVTGVEWCFVLGLLSVSIISEGF
jgi:hypothetical protein